MIWNTYLLGFVAEIYLPGRLSKGIW